jgi:hypothetical protein
MVLFHHPNAEFICGKNWKGGCIVRNVKDKNGVKYCKCLKNLLADEISEFNFMILRPESACLHLDNLSGSISRTVGDKDLCRLGRSLSDHCHVVLIDLEGPC